MKVHLVLPYIKVFEGEMCECKEADVPNAECIHDPSLSHHFESTPDLEQTRSGQED